MRKRVSPLKLHRETLLHLASTDFAAIRGGNGFADNTDDDSCVRSCSPHVCPVQALV
ncbi:MAG TPA: hypothetical protein VGE98_01455 [Thermoanaerobaculia bacterium]